MKERFTVVIEDDLAGLACSRGYLWWKQIVVHPVFFQMDDAARDAVIFHEIGHYVHCHNEIRWLWFLFGWGLFYDWLVLRQEYAADAFAVAHGHGPALLRVLQRFNDRLPPSSLAARIAKLSA